MEDSTSQTLPVCPETLDDVKKKAEECGFQFSIQTTSGNGINHVQNPAVTPSRCCVPGCNNIGIDGKPLFDFPPEEFRCHQWVLYCQRLALMLGMEKLTSLTDLKICSDHFRPEHFVKNTTTLLKRTAVPCVNPTLPSPAPIATNSLHCRLCALTSRHTISIYGLEGDELQLADKVSALLPVTLDRQDSLPKQICTSCAKSLEAMIPLAESCLKAELKFASLRVPSPYEDVTTNQPETDLRPGDACNLCPDGKMVLSQEEKNTQCKLCETQLNGFSKTLNHSLEHSTEFNFPCAICEQNFNSENSLVIHLVDHNLFIDAKTSPSSSFNLPEPTSPKASPSPVFQEDTSTSTGSVTSSDVTEYYPEKLKKFNCNICERSFSTAGSLRNHQNTHRPHKPYSCEWCKKSFMRKSMLRNHIAAYHSAVEEHYCFVCNVCYEAFPTTETALAHVASKHEVCDSEAYQITRVSRLLRCEYCDRLYAEGKVLNRHRAMVHSMGSYYNCKCCETVFNSYAELLSHKENHECHQVPLEYLTEEEVHASFLCEFCERNFPNYTKYTEHTTIHYGPEPYICLTCNTKFASGDALSQHKKYNSGHEGSPGFDFNRPFGCHYCTKSFAIEDALVKHIRMHTGEKPFLCEQCGKGFSQSSGLNTHKKVHSNVRPYACDLCPRTFKIKGDRDVHLRKHSGERPYTCEYCDKAFMTQHVYSQHRKIHTNERPYRCDVCGMAFRRSHVLTVHKRIHSGEKPNVCDVCGKCYRQKGDMLKHRRAQHPTGTVKGEQVLFPEYPYNTFN